MKKQPETLDEFEDAIRTAQNQIQQLSYNIRNYEAARNNLPEVHNRHNNVGQILCEYSDDNYESVNTFYLPHVYDNNRGYTTDKIDIFRTKDDGEITDEVRVQIHLNLQLNACALDDAIVVTREDFKTFREMIKQIISPIIEGTA